VQADLVGQRNRHLGRAGRCGHDALAAHEVDVTGQAASRHRAACRFLGGGGHLVEVRATLRGDRGRDGALDQRRVREPCAIDSFDGHLGDHAGAAEVVEQHDAGAVVRLFECRGHGVEVGADAALGRAARGDGDDVRRHLRRHLHHPGREAGAVRDDHQSDAAHLAATSANARSSSEVDRAPGSMCPALRSPR
jgi:hypothetical protein